MYELSFVHVRFIRTNVMRFDKSITASLLMVFQNLFSELQFQIAMCQAPTADVPVDNVETVGENLTGDTKIQYRTSSVNDYYMYKHSAVGYL